MKTVSILVLFALSLTTVSAQFKTFFNNYGGSRDDLGKSMIQDGEGNYIITGQTFSYLDTNSDVYLLKINPNGDTLWTKSFGGSLLDGGNNIIGTSDGGYLISGHADVIGNDCDAIIIKTDKDGNSDWIKYYGSAGDDVPSCGAQTPDGGFIITGNTENYGAVGRDVWLFKLAPDGAMEWMKVFGGNGIDLGISVVVTKDSGYLVAGTTEIEGKGTDLYLVKTDRNGNLQWEKNYGGPLFEASRVICHLANEAGYIICGTKQMDSTNFDAVLWKLDEGGSLIWEKTYGGSKEEIFRGISVCNDGGFIAAGNSKSGADTLDDIFLVKTDANGKVVWQNYYGGVGTDVAYSVLQTPDGGFAATGWVASFGNGRDDVFLLKTDMFGNVIAGINPILREEPAKVFPNPTDKYIYIILNEPITSGQALIFSLFDLSGKVIYAFPLSTNEVMKDISQLPIGMYEYSIYGKGNSTNYRGKIVVQY